MQETAEGLFQFCRALHFWYGRAWVDRNGKRELWSNQKSNAYHKEIADRSDIEKNFTTHLARHTFATTVTLTNGVPIETVGKMLGHKNLRTTQHYAKIIDSKVEEDMKVLREKLAGMDNKEQRKEV
ncbi:tyrosine-type recombinase/integrase [Maribacter sp. 2-571]|uniref:tyrosine-type recombinase/integrase n=1 Tax=Maribacter sp. 2-571 TaxID=3417569 RepID=UPI003D33044F